MSLIYLQLLFAATVVNAVYRGPLYAVGGPLYAVGDRVEYNYPTGSEVWLPAEVVEFTDSADEGAFCVIEYTKPGRAEISRKTLDADWMRDALRRPVARAPVAQAPVAQAFLPAAVLVDDHAPAEDARPADEDDLPTCAICMAAVEQNGTGELAPHTRARCGHIFHTGCAQRWAERSRACPLCRVEEGINLSRAAAARPQEVQQQERARLQQEQQQEQQRYLGYAESQTQRFVVGFEDDYVRDPRHEQWVLQKALAESARHEGFKEECVVREQEFRAGRYMILKQIGTVQACVSCTVCHSNICGIHIQSGYHIYESRPKLALVMTNCRVLWYIYSA